MPVVSVDEEGQVVGAHPGGCLHLALAAMHEFPHGWPFVHRLQHA
jgi:hypothetical protein